MWGRIVIKCQHGVSGLPKSQDQFSEQGNDYHFQRDWEFSMSEEIILTAEYLLGRLNVRVVSAFRNFQDSSYSKYSNYSSIPRNLCKVGIPRVGYFCIKSRLSDAIWPVIESRSTKPSNRCIPTELETSEATVCYFLLFQ